MTGRTVLLALAVAAGLAGALMLAQAKDETGGEQVNDDVVTGLIGRSYEDAVRELGPPASETGFRLGPDVMEFRVELKNFFDAARLASAPPEVREATWRLTPERNLTLWFVREAADWTALHHLDWHPDDQF